jgi:hypothetical protein
MKNCPKCQENNWEYRTLEDGETRATCIMCDYEFDFISRQKHRKDWKRYLKKKKKYAGQAT